MRQSEQDNIAFIGVGIVLLIIVVVGVALFVTRHQRATQTLVTQLSKQPMDTVENNSKLSQTDAWGRPLHFQRTAGKYAISQRITSDGKDGKFGTADDIVAVDIDYNKSRIVGHWVGQKSKEFVKGLWQGEEEPTRFEKLNKEEPTSQPSIFRRLFRKKE